LKFKKKSKVDPKIPDASMPDIVFMLLIFFMVTTVMKESDGLKVELPDANKIKKLEGKTGVATIWADTENQISIDDKLIQPDQISDLVYAKAIDPVKPMKIVSLRIDKNVEMVRVSEIHEELRDVGGAALNVNYSSIQAAD